MERYNDIEKTVLVLSGPSTLTRHCVVQTCYVATPRWPSPTTIDQPYDTLAPQLTHQEDTVDWET